MQYGLSQFRRNGVVGILMAKFIFILGALLVVGGIGGLIASIDLTGTEVGLLYGGGGMIALSGGVITTAIAALIQRVDAAARRFSDIATFVPAIADASPAAGGLEPEIAAPETAVRLEDAAEPAVPPETLEGAPSEPASELIRVGHYSADGSNYTVYSDGSLEAHTPDGIFKFESLDAFKVYLAARGA